MIQVRIDCISTEAAMLVKPFLAAMGCRAVGRGEYIVTVSFNSTETVLLEAVIQICTAAVLEPNSTITRFEVHR